jgi:hypothetical protein
MLSEFEESDMSEKWYVWKVWNILTCIWLLFEESDMMKTSLQRVWVFAWNKWWFELLLIFEESTW